MIDQRTSETSFVTATDGVRLAVECLGEGPPLYAIHGGPSSDRKSFGGYLDPVARYRRLCLLDQRGCGDSGDCAPEGYTLERLAQDIEDTRLQLGHGKIALLGHSFGGPVSLSYTLRWPETVAALVLVDAPIRGWKDIVLAPRSWPLWARSIQESFSKNSDWTAFTLKYEVANPDKAEEVHALMTRPIRYDPARVQRLTSAGAKPLDVKPLLKAGVPVFGIYGKQDTRFLAAARYLRSTGARVTLFARAGHTPFIEQPDKFHTALDKFLADT